MTNICITTKYKGVKPPVVRSINKQTSYIRSPSTSRLNTNNISNSTISPTKNSATPPFSSTRKIGSCQNLATLNNYSQSDFKTEMSQFQPKIDKYYTQSRYGTVINRSSTTNNSFGNRDNSQPLKASSNSTFYNGYHDELSPSSIKNRFINNKSLSSGSSSTNSSEATGTTVSNSLSGSGGTHYTTTSSSGTNTNTYSSSSKSHNVEIGNKYKCTENGTSSRNGSVITIPSSTKSETTKSLNNSVNDNRGLVGLANLGNTCFMNSVLQCLSNCKPLHEYCLSNKPESDLNSNSKTRGTLIKSYCEMMKSMWRTDGESYISPDKFRRTFQRIAPSFNSSAQQDSQEFLRIMLEGLHQDVNKVQQRPRALKIDEEEDEKLPEKELAQVYWNRYIRMDNSFIVELFVGQLKSTLLCRKCGYKSVTFDPFWDLSLPIPKNHRGNTTLTECLDLFTSEEELEGDEMPKCARCKQKRPCSKSFSIQKFPPVLVIHLKRFSGDRYRSKISTFIEFPSTTLDLSRYAANTSAQKNGGYSLFGISNHSGTVYGGHYTAYCCHPYTRLWYEFNDTRVRRVDDSRVCSSEAYVLFYELVR